MGRVVSPGFKVKVPTLIRETDIQNQGSKIQSQRVVGERETRCIQCMITKQSRFSYFDDGGFSVKRVQSKVELT